MTEEKTQSTRVQNAIKLAVEKHYGSFRKGAVGGSQIPYIVHPIAVMDLVWRWGAGTEDMLCAAACHDTKEDTNVTWAELVEIIGADATFIVSELTFDETSGMSKEEYMASFDKKSVEALVIKVADRILNVLDFALTDLSYAKKYLGKAKDLFFIFAKRKEEIKNVFGENALNNIETSYNRMIGTLASI